jgi:ferredoxin
MIAKPSTHIVTVLSGETAHTLHVAHGANLRQALLDAGMSPYARLTKKANCGGRGLCATCGVRIAAAPPPTHWHDRIGNAFGYPRLSCQVQVDGPLTVRLLQEKRIWGAPWTNR